MIRQVEVEVKTSEIAGGLLQRLLDGGAREKHSTFRMIMGRQWVKYPRVQILVANLVRAHRRQLLPSRPCGQPHTNSSLHRFSPRHRSALGGAVGEIVALVD